MSKALLELVSAFPAGGAIDRGDQWMPTAALLQFARSVERLGEATGGTSSVDSSVHSTAWGPAVSHARSYVQRHDSKPLAHITRYGGGCCQHPSASICCLNRTASGPLGWQAVSAPTSVVVQQVQLSEQDGQQCSEPAPSVWVAPTVSSLGSVDVSARCPAAPAPVLDNDNVAEEAVYVVLAHHRCGASIGLQHNQVVHIWIHRRMVTFQQLLLQLLDEVVGLTNAANDVLAWWPGSCLRGQAPPPPLHVHVA